MEVAAWLFGHLATRWGCLGAPPGVDELRAPPAPGMASTDGSAGGGALPADGHARGGTSARGFAPEQALVLDAMRSTSIWGSDVRVSTGQLFNPSGLPRAPISPQRRHWRTCMEFEWRQPAHVNELEMRAFLSALRWRLRAEKNLEMQVFAPAGQTVSLRQTSVQEHPVDSRGSQGCLS